MTRAELLRIAVAYALGKLHALMEKFYRRRPCLCCLAESQ